MRFSSIMQPKARETLQVDMGQEGVDHEGVGQGERTGAKMLLGGGEAGSCR